MGLGYRRNYVQIIALVSIPAMLLSAATLVHGSAFLAFGQTADTTQPSVSISAPISGSNVFVGSVLISGKAADNSGGSGIKTVQVRTDLVSYATATPKAPGDWSSWSISLNLSSEGTRSISARATDNAGNQQWHTITVTVASQDAVKPTVSISSPLDKSTITGPSTGVAVQVSGKASDSGSGIKIVQVRTDSASYKSATPKAPGDWSSWSISLNLPYGAHSISARATDNAGNQQWHTITVTAAAPPPATDSVKPTVSITSPSGGAIITGPSTGVAVQVSGKASDSGSGIKQVDVRTDTLSYQTATPKAPGDWSTWTMSTTITTAGPNTIYARAIDKSGNQEWYSIPITVSFGSSSGGSLDKFGVKKIAETKTGGREWFVKWDSDPRKLTWGWDPKDPEFDLHGTVDSLTIHGNGTATVDGDSPRFYIHDKTNLKKWQNVEMTFYAKRISESRSASYQAFTAGARTGYMGGDNCDGFGYYGKAQFDGKFVFNKELINHVAYSTVEPYPWVKPWPSSGPMPKNVWIGYKFVIRNMDDNQSVKLQIYMDETNGVNGGTWKKIVEYTDDGDWFSSDEPWGSNNYTWIDCGDGRTKNWVITGSYPTVHFRTDFVSKAQYKWLSVREISPLP